MIIPSHPSGACSGFLQRIVNAASSLAAVACWGVAAVMPLAGFAADPARPPVVIPGVRGNTTTSRFGEGYTTRAADGTTYRTSKFGNGWITQSSDGQTYTTSGFGNGAITRGPNGLSVTTSPFGSGMISHVSGGTAQAGAVSTVTTSRFGAGTVTRSSSGQSTSVSPFGSGFISNGQNSGSARDKGALLILPAPK